MICIVTEDNRVFLINSENLTIIKNLYFNNNSVLNIKQNSKITSINFDCFDTLFFGLSDGSIIKYKFNEEPINLKLDSLSNNIAASSEDEFDNIKCIFSTDRLIQNYDGINSNPNIDFSDYNIGNFGLNNNNINNNFNEIMIAEDVVNEDKSFLTRSSENTDNSFHSKNSKIIKNDINVIDNSSDGKNSNFNVEVENLDVREVNKKIYVDSEGNKLTGIKFF